MPRFSANLGFLWTELALPEAIRAAHLAGFDAVEVHWPYDVSVADLRTALDETGLPLLGLNTRRGDVAAGENGLAAVPGREDAARAAIAEAVDYAAAAGAAAVHVMAGKAEGERAARVFEANLAFACDRAAPHGIGVLIEALNPWDAPGYFLRTTDQALGVIERVDRPNLALMFDCYHVARTEGAVATHLAACLPRIGHIQFAGVPDRGPPDGGTLDHRDLFARIDALGWTRPLGAEYRPGGPTEATLGWMRALVD